MMSLQGVVSRELVQLEDLLKWSERGLAEEGDEGVETVAEAVQVREEANKVVQVREMQLSSLRPCTNTVDIPKEPPLIRTP